MNPRKSPYSSPLVWPADYSPPAPIRHVPEVVEPSIRRALGIPDRPGFDFRDCTIWRDDPGHDAEPRPCPPAPECVAEDETASAVTLPAVHVEDSGEDGAPDGFRYDLDDYPLEVRELADRLYRQANPGHVLTSAMPRTRRFWARKALARLAEQEGGES